MEKIIADIVAWLVILSFIYGLLSIVGFELFVLIPVQIAKIKRLLREIKDSQRIDIPEWGEIDYSYLDERKGN